MFTYDFSKKGTMTFCDFLIENIKSKIIDGTLSPNEKLPSKRTLASHLGVSVITVQNAYSELISQGYIFSIEKKGFFVTELPKEIKSLSSNSYKQNFKKEKSIKKINSKNKEKIFIDLKSNSIGWEKFPFSIWSKIMRKVLNSPHENLLKSQPLQGTLELREAICKHLKSFKNIDAVPEQIVVGAGTEMLYSFVVQLLGIEKIYAVENPGYKKIAQIFEMNGANIKHIPIDKNGLNIEALKKTNASVVHVTPSHHFPTGIVMPVRRRQEILAWANKAENRFIIEDDYDSEFRFLGKPLTPLFSSEYNNKNKVIYINTFTKSLSPSFRIGYLVLPENLLPIFNEKLGFFSNTVSSFEQFVLAKFMEKGFFEKHIIKMKNYYRSLRNNLIYCLEKSSLSSFCKIKEEEAGLHFLLEIDKKMNSKDLKLLFEKNKIVIPFLEDFYYQNKMILEKPTLVINYSGLKKDDIPKSVKILETLLV